MRIVFSIGSRNILNRSKLTNDSEWRIVPEVNRKSQRCANEMKKKLIRPNESRLSLTLGQMERYAGGSKYKMDDRMKNLAGPVLETARQLIDPAFSYCIYEPGELDGRTIEVLTGAGDMKNAGHGADSFEICVCVCTLGKALETAVSDMMKKGNALEAAFLDAAGVGLLESLGQIAFSRVRREAEKKSLYPGCRFGPGYGKTPLEVQTTIFSLVDSRPLGLMLLDSYAMSPAKSLSFWVIFHATPRAEADIYKCGACGLKDCPYRVVNDPL